MKPRRLAPHPASTGRPCPPEPGGGRRWEVAGRSGGADPEPEARPSPERTASLWPPPATCAHIARTPSGAAGGRGAPTSTAPRPCPRPWRPDQPPCPSACCTVSYWKLSPLGPSLTQHTAVLFRGATCLPGGRRHGDRACHCLCPAPCTPRRAGPEPGRVWGFYDFVV